MNFNYQGYELKFIQKKPCRDESAHLFTIVFKFYSPVTKYFYVLHADYHDEDIFAIKFYCKKDKRSKYKYSKLVNRGDVGNILITCLKVLPLLLPQYPTASFSFVGSRTLDPVSQKLESYINNQRFRMYVYIVAKKIGVQTFTHLQYEHISGYVLLNNNSKDLIAKEAAIVAMFQNTYHSVHDIA